MIQDKNPSQEEELNNDDRWDKSFQEAYKNFYDKGNERDFDTLLDLLDNLYARVVKRYLIINGCYNEDTYHEAMQEARLAVWRYILRTIKESDPQKSIAAYSRAIYVNNAYNVIRKVLSNKKRYGEISSMEAPLNGDGTSLENFVEDTEADVEYEIQREDTRSIMNSMFIQYCRAMTDIKARVPAQLALYYARILPHVLSVYYGEKTIPENKASSAAWAYNRMGENTIGVLGETSQEEMQEYISGDLEWGEHFYSQLEEMIPSPKGEIRMMDAVYTHLYDKRKIDKWSGILHERVLKLASREIAKDTALVELSKEYISRRDRLSGMLKGGGDNVTFD